MADVERCQLEVMLLGSGADKVFGQVDPAVGASISAQVAAGLTGNRIGDRRCTRASKRRATSDLSAERMPPSNSTREITLAYAAPART